MDSGTTLNDQKPPGYPCRLDRLVSPFYCDEFVTLYCGNAFDFVSLSSDQSIDLLLTDPPYGVTDKAWDEVPDPRKWLYPFLNRLCLVIPGQNNFFLYPRPTWVLCWHQPGAVSQIFGSRTGGMRNWDPILVYGRGCFPNDVIRTKPKKLNTDGVHGTRKPEVLMRWLIDHSGTTGTIFDPFAGTGTTLVAAKLCGRKAIGVELDERHCEVAVERLRQGVLDFDSEG